MHDADPPLPVTTSREPEWTFEARECYRDVVQALRQARIACAVGGAFAFQKHTGIWRATKDLDLLLEARYVPRALRRLRQAGFTTSIDDPVWLAKATRGNYFVDLITGVGSASLWVDASWIERAATGDILGLPCRVLAAEEMIASKLFVTRRERFDGSDVVHLIRSCAPRLDWDRVLHLVDCHWQLLHGALVLFAYVYPAQTGLVPERLWVELSHRFANEATHPRGNDAFRGSLVDPLMFAIDVNERGERNLYREYCERHPCLIDAGEVPVVPVDLPANEGNAP